jgi:catalase
MTDRDRKQPATTTTDSGIPVTSDEHSLTAGPNGPTVLHDAHLVQKMQHFNRERVPERVVHAKGSGAHGFFEVTEDVTQWTNAAFLSEVGKRTPMFARFSTVAGEMGSADTVRDPRGFALKFYTEEGNYDLVGNNTPTFFVRDAMKFEDFIRSQKRMPDTGLRSNDAVAGVRAPGHDPHVGPRYPAHLPQHERLLEPHVLVDERGRRALLGEVPLQDCSGHRELQPRRGRRDGG